MPRKPVDYSRTIIYKIVCRDLTIKDVYVGSTTNFVKRKYMHKTFCNKEKYKEHNFKIYKIIRDNGGWDNWEMIEIEKYNCNDKREAETKERFWYEQLYSNMNTYRPLRTKEERKERKTQYNKKYYQEKKEYFEIKKNEWRKNNPNYDNEYREKNIVKINEYEKKRNSIKTKCVCGSIYIKRQKYKHEKSKKHINYVNSL